MGVENRADIGSVDPILIISKNRSLRQANLRAQESREVALWASGTGYLNSLPKGQQDAVRLRYLGDGGILSYGRSAEILGVCAMTVYCADRRGIAKLKKRKSMYEDF